MLQENQEKFDSLIFDHEKLLENYNNLLRLDSIKRRENEEMAVIKVLRDKLMAKDAEIQNQVGLIWW